MKTVTILGAGAMGAGLTKPLTDNGHTVRLWATEYDRELLDALRSQLPHPGLDTPLPDSVELYDTGELSEALRDTSFIILATNTQGIIPVSKALAEHLNTSVPIISVAKGFVEIDGHPRLVADAIEAVLNTHSLDAPVITMAGPSIASEMARGSWTAVCIGGDDPKRVKEIADSMQTPAFGVVPERDLAGIEICSAYKNAYAIALAWPAGLTEREQGSTRNLEAILYLQVLEELKILVAGAGGAAETVTGYPGLGDFIATSSGGRNGALGKLLGEGNTLDDSLNILKQKGINTIEGLDAARLGKLYLKSMAGIVLDDLPLLKAIDEVLDRDIGVVDALRKLMPRVSAFQ